MASSSSRVPLLMGNKGRKPTRLPIAPRARPSNVDRTKRTPPSALSAASLSSAASPIEVTSAAPSTSAAVAEPPPPSSTSAPEHLKPASVSTPMPTPMATPVAVPAAPRAGGIAPGRAVTAPRAAGTAPRVVGRPQQPSGPAVRTATIAPRRPQVAAPVERLSKITSKSVVPLFRPQEPRTHASPILGPRATPIPAPHSGYGESHGQSSPYLQHQDQNPLHKRMARKLDIKPHQSPRRVALQQNQQQHARQVLHGLPTITSPLSLSIPAAPIALDAVTLEPLEPRKPSPKKRGTKRRTPEAMTTRKPTKVVASGNPQRRSLRRKVQRKNSYNHDNDGDDDEEDDEADDLDADAGDDGDGDDLHLPNQENPQIYMPARERATLWARKVLREQEEADNGEATGNNSTLAVKKDKQVRRKRSNSSLSIVSVSTTPRKRKASDQEQQQQKEPSQMTMGELALSIPKGRRMARHEHEESADYHGANNGSGHALNRVRSLSVSSDLPPGAFGSSMVTPQVEIIDGKMVILESTVNPMPSHTSEEADDSARRPRGSRYLAASAVPGRRWNKDETKQFYYCLSQVGPNFSMMATLFPTRKRKELKSKFKYEEKHHPGLIEIALKASTAPLDAEIVDVIGQMVDKETQKKEAKRRKRSEDVDEDALLSPATVASSAVPSPPLEQTGFAEEDYGDYYRERKNSFDFSG